LNALLGDSSSEDE
jgi:hypothetical protein